MLKDYIVNGLQFQYEEGKQPKAAKPVPAKKPSNKQGKPETKQGDGKAAE